MEVQIPMWLFAASDRVLPASGRLLSAGTLVRTSLLPSALFWIPLSALFTVK